MSEDVQVTHLDSAGIKTVFTLSGGSWLVTKAEDEAEESTFTYTRDAQGRVTRMTAPVPNGVTCGTTLVVGCRALELTYATTTTATGVGSGWGDYTGLVKQISFTAYDPATSAMKTTPVTTYSYDSTGHLRTATNATTGLTTTYYYDAQGRISQLTPPGLAPWRMEYDTSGRLAHVQHESGTVDPTEAVVYSIPIGGTGAPVDLTLTETSKWGQVSDLPRVGAAIFPPSRVPARGGDGTYQPSAEDYKDATLSYLDANGRAVNTATFGAGAWQVATTRYDDKGNIVWRLTPGNRVQALAATGDTDPYTAARPTSSDRANLLASTSTYSADSDLLSSEGPAHPVKLSSGVIASIRQRVTYIYDEGKPDGNSYHLVTTTRSEPTVLDSTSDPTAADLRTVKTGYDPIVAGDKSGWDLRAATIQTVVMSGAADIVRRTRYNNAGLVIESRLPESNGADAGTALSVYYTAGGSGPAQCRKPEWASLLCRSEPKGQPTTGKPLPITEVTGYNYLGQPTTTVGTAGSTTRTVTNRYDEAGRVIGTATVAAPQADGGTPFRRSPPPTTRPPA